MVMDSIKKIFIFLSVIGLSMGCQDEGSYYQDSGAELLEEQQAIIEQYLTENNIATQQNELGMHYRVLTENTRGASPQPNQVVTLYYQIEQLEGGIIDVREEGAGHDPLAYTFNFNSDLNPGVRHLLVPVGLDFMVGTMREREEYEFYLPSGYAYLDYALEDVVPARALIRAKLRIEGVFTADEYRLEEDAKLKEYLADQQLEEADSLPLGVYYVQTKAGDGQEIASGSSVEVRYTGSLLDGTVFDTNVGNGNDLLEFELTPGNVIAGFFLAVQRMSVGEKGTVVIPSHAAYGQGLVAIPYSYINELTSENAIARRIPPYAPLRFDIEVVNVK